MVNRINKDDITAADVPSKMEFVPPDGGWGWLVLLGSMLILFCTSGATWFSAINTGMVNQGLADYATISGIPALYQAFSLLLAPFNANLTQYYSHRRISITGVIILTIGRGLSCFSTNVVWLYICLGVISGIGAGLTQFNHILLGQRYFPNKRVMAMSICLFGSCLGFAFSPIILRGLIRAYSLNGAFLVWSSITFNGIVGASLYHPVEWHLKKSFSINTENTGNQSTNMLSFESATDDKNNMDDSQNKLVIHDTLKERTSEENVAHQATITNMKKRPLSELDSFYDSVDRPLSLYSTRTIDSYATVRTRYKSTDLFNSMFFLDTMGSYSTIASSVGIGQHNAIELKEMKSTFENKNLVKAHEKENHLNEKNKEETFEVQQKCQRKEPYIIFGLKIPRLSEVFSFALLSNPVFILLATAFSFNRQATGAFFVYLPVIAKDIDMEEGSFYLLMICSGSQFLCLIILSSISSRSWFNKRYAVMSGCLLSVISYLVLCFMKSLATLIFSCVITGMYLALGMSINPILLVEYISIELLPKSLGLVYLCMGLTGLLFYPIQGSLFDLMKSSLGMNLVLVFLTLISFCCLLVVPLVKRKMDSSRVIDTSTVPSP